MTAHKPFLLTLTACLVGLWAFSGDRFLDWAFAMPELGIVDDYALAGLVAVEDAKTALGLPDLFGALRAQLHSWMGV